MWHGLASGYASLNQPGDFWSCYQAPDDTGAYCINGTSTELELAPGTVIPPTLGDTTPETIFTATMENLPKACNFTNYPTEMVSNCNLIAGTYHYSQVNDGNLSNWQYDISSGLCVADGKGPLAPEAKTCFLNVMSTANEQARALYPKVCPDSSQMSTGMKVGIGVGVGTTALATIVGLFFLRRFRAPLERGPTLGRDAVYERLPEGPVNDI